MKKENKLFFSFGLFIVFSSLLQDCLTRMFSAIKLLLAWIIYNDRPYSMSKGEGVQTKSNSRIQNTFRESCENPLKKQTSLCLFLPKFNARKHTETL